LNIIDKINIALETINKFIDNKDDNWFQQINISKKQFRLFVDELVEMKRTITSKEKFSPHFIPYIIIDQWSENAENDLKYLLLSIVSKYNKLNS